MTYKINNTKLTKLIKHDYFSLENIKKYPERLVIVGFIASDGCIRIQKTGQKLLIFNQSKKDKCALDIINNELAGGIRNLAEIKATNSLMLVIPSSQICEDLLYYNITPCKSITYKFPEHLDILEMSYFLKGYFFGDGCLDLHNSKSEKCLLAGSINFCNNLKIYLENNKIVDKCNLYKVKKSNNYMVTHITGQNANMFSQYIFRDDYFNLLPRKIKIINNILLNSKWTSQEKLLLLQYTTKNIEEFCKLSNRTKSSALDKLYHLKKHNGIIPYRGKKK